MLTGKAKEDFEEWLNEKNYNCLIHATFASGEMYCIFDVLEINMKFGVYVDFALYKGVKLIDDRIDRWEDLEKGRCELINEFNKLYNENN